MRSLIAPLLLYPHYVVVTYDFFGYFYLNFLVSLSDARSKITFVLRDYYGASNNNIENFFETEF